MVLVSHVPTERDAIRFRFCLDRWRRVLVVARLRVVSAVGLAGYSLLRRGAVLSQSERGCGGGDGEQECGGRAGGHDEQGGGRPGGRRAREQGLTNQTTVAARVPAAVARWGGESAGAVVPGVVVGAGGPAGSGRGIMPHPTCEPWARRYAVLLARRGPQVRADCCCVLASRLVSLLWVAAMTPLPAAVYRSRPCWPRRSYSAPSRPARSAKWLCRACALTASSW